MMDESAGVHDQQLLPENQKPPFLTMDEVDLAGKRVLIFVMKVVVIVERLDRNQSIRTDVIHGNE